MDKPTLLIVDDEITIHVILKAILRDIYDLEFASNAQQAIDIISEKTINLVLLDIQMPELSGLELLESLMIDSALREVPIIIITGKVTEERETRARELGAADFVGKDTLYSDSGKSLLMQKIRENVKNIQIPPFLKSDLKTSSTAVIRRLLSDAEHKDFFDAARKLGTNLMSCFKLDYISFWSTEGKSPNMLLFLGGKQPDNFGPEDIKSEDAYHILTEEKKPYLTNNAFSEKKGIFASAAMEKGLSSEIGIPLFKMNRKQLTENNMQIPPNTPVYGFVILKRNRVFTSYDYRIMVKTVQYCGSVLWGLFEILVTE